MTINFVSKHLPVTEGMRSYAEKKMPRITKFFDFPIDVTITISTLKNWQTVEVLINAKGLYLKGAEKSEDFYASLDLAIDKIERQISKYKDRIKSRKYSDMGADPLKMNVYESESIEKSQPTVIVTKDIDGKPMSIDEAVMQMNLLNKEFFIFKSGSGITSVVYKRDDGNIGLITA